MDDIQYDDLQYLEGRNWGDVPATTSIYSDDPSKEEEENLSPDSEEEEEEEEIPSHQPPVNKLRNLSGRRRWGMREHPVSSRGDSYNLGYGWAPLLRQQWWKGGEILNVGEDQEQAPAEENDVPSEVTTPTVQPSDAAVDLLKSLSTTKKYHSSQIDTLKLSQQIDDIPQGLTIHLKTSYTLDADLSERWNETLSTASKGLLDILLDHHHRKISDTNTKINALQLPIETIKKVEQELMALPKPPPKHNPNKRPIHMREQDNPKRHRDFSIPFSAKCLKMM